MGKKYVALLLVCIVAAVAVEAYPNETPSHRCNRHCNIGCIYPAAFCKWWCGVACEHPLPGIWDKDSFQDTKTQQHPSAIKNENYPVPTEKDYKAYVSSNPSPSTSNHS